MNRKWVALVVSALIAAPASAEDPPQFKSDRDKASYLIGVQTGRNFKKDQIDIDPEQLLNGIKDGMAGTSQVSEDDTRKFMSAFMNDLKRKSRIGAEDNRMKAAAFLQENKTRPGVVVLPSGVQYKILKSGDGKKPVDTDDVVCEYRGTLLDGTEFDKTDPGKPVTFKVAGLIPGWREALKLMPVGSKWQLFVSPEHAYGARGAGLIGPNELLMFEVQLIAIK
jgi:FKBP-type peptidyl-prolyl cis-trans isomerase FklB